MQLNHKQISPLRYPGGKSRISSFIEDIILLNALEGCTLYELYAGGAGASLNILLQGLCNKIVLNDLDYHIYAFWYSVLNRTDELVALIYDTEVNLTNWDMQKAIYENFHTHDILHVGFSTFFLNRSNRSGILYKAGPIGGRNQTGNYKIDVRFNKRELIERINRIALLRDRVEIKNSESIELLRSIFTPGNGSSQSHAVPDRNKPSKKFIFLDPPYYVQGERLYLNFYDDSNHVDLKEILLNSREENWFLTYDNCDRINDLYKDFRRSHLPMSYTLQRKRKSKEVMVFSDSLHLPKQLRLGNESINFHLINQADCRPADCRPAGYRPIDTCK